MKPEDWNLEGTYRKCDFSNSPWLDVNL
jgi:hypothetical protein